MKNFNILQGVANLLRSILVTHDERGKKTSNWFRLFARRAARKLVADDSGPILDTGSADGLLFDPTISRLTPVTTLLDLDDSLLKEARQHYGNQGSFVCGDLTNLPFRDGIFSVSLCVGTFYNFPVREMVQQGLCELARVTKRHGRVIADFRNAHHPQAYLADRIGLKYDPTITRLPQNAYTLDQIRHMFSQAGLEIQRIETVGIPIKQLPLIYIIEASRNDHGESIKDG